MANITWTPQARRDLEAVEDYFLDVAPHYAPLVVDGLLESTARLDRFPNSGRIVPEMGDESLREVVWRDYRVIYRTRAARVEVLTVQHTSRRFRPPGRP